MSQAPRRGPRGQVLALFALFLVVLIGATAVTVDYGTWLKSRRDYQNVADAAVLAGGGFLSRPIDNTKREFARRAAWDSLNAQLSLGLTNGQLNSLDSSNTPAGAPEVFNGYRLWVSTPPIGATSRYPGLFTGASDRYLFAWVEKDNPSFFSRVFGQGDRTVSAWATAGVFPSQFALITLRRQGQGPNSAPSDIDLDGNNTVLEVVDGDVGGNWGMKLTSASSLWLSGDADAYLVDYVSCGNSCWSPNQVSSGPPGFVLENPQQMPNLIDDPNYPLPAALSALPTTPTTAIPKGGGTDVPPPADRFADLTITNGSISGLGCSATSPRIGPGFYDDINVSGCLILDPLHTYSDPNDSVAPFGDFGLANVPETQQPGIFYITGALNVNNGALVVGDGVSLVLRDQVQPGLVVSGGANGGIVDINTGAESVLGNQVMKKAAFKTDGSYSYTFNATLGVWEYTADNNDKSTTGVAIYVVKPAQLGNNTSDASTASVTIGGGAALSWEGILYAPRDNIKLSGQPNHNAIGQFISWTVMITGGSTIRQIYDGPGEAAARLVEPRLGQ